MFLKIFLYLLYCLIFCSNLSANSLIYKNLLNDIKMDINENYYVQEEKKVITMLRNGGFNRLHDLKSKVYFGQDNKTAYFEELINLHNKNQSIFFAQLLADESMRFFNINKIENFNKYISPVMPILERHNMCDAYLFRGILNEINGDFKNAMNEYKIGTENCKVTYKNFSMLSRFNKLSFLLKKEKK